MRDSLQPLTLSFLIWISSVPLYLYLDMPWWVYPFSFGILTAAAWGWNALLGAREGDSQFDIRYKRNAALSIAGFFAILLISLVVVFYR